MIKDARIKNNTAISLGYIWAVGLLLFSVYSVFSEGKVVSIWVSAAAFYLTYKYSVQTRGTQRFSLLAILFVFIGGLILFAAVGELIFNGKLYYLTLVPLGALHILIGFWAYQNLEENTLNRLTSTNQRDADYEVINFVLVRELVSKLKGNNFSILTSGEYKTEITDAAIQVISEQTLLRSTKAIQMLKQNPDKSQKNLEEKYLRELVDQLDQEAIYQLYPLSSNNETYLDFFYFGDFELRQKVQNALLKIDPKINPSDLEEDYFNNNLCAKHWPIISKYI